MDKDLDDKLRDMSIEQLIEVRETIDGFIRKEYEEEQEKLATLASRIPSDILPKQYPSKQVYPGAVTRAAAKPNFRSKKEPQQTWVGRGRQPKWMDEEIAEGLGASKEDFRIPESERE